MRRARMPATTRRAHAGIGELAGPVVQRSGYAFCENIASAFFLSSSGVKSLMC